MTDSFFKISYFILLLVWMFIRQFFGKAASRTETVKSLRPGLERFLAILNFTSMGVIPVYVVFGPRLDFAVMGLPQIIRLLGLIVYFLNIGLFLSCHKYLGRHWSMILEIRKDHKLIREGPYKRIRHPMYTHFWLLIISQGIILDNWVVLLYGIVTWSMLYFVRINMEEKMMLEEFGAEYEEYMKSTGRLLPKLR